MSSSLPPRHVQILVIGGGPGGAYAASAMAREGLDVAVFEAAKFPRYHVGESLIPSIRHYMRFIDAEEKIAAHGFVRKPGSAIKFNQFKREGYTDFIALGHDNNAWNVVRSEFDQILLSHARTSHASIHELTRVTTINFSSSGKPVSADWVHTPVGGTGENNSMDSDLETVAGTTTFDYLVDASGRAGILSTGYLKNRHFNASLKNVAVWGYWTGVETYGKGTEREGSPWFEALVDESGWAWFIPLHNSTTSIGIVMTQKIFTEKRKKSGSHSTMTSRYLAHIALAPGVRRLIGDGKLVGVGVDGEEGGVKCASDFSYSAPSYAGNGYRIVGDAGDPFFSSGIHLALTSALSAASTICAALRGDCGETEAGQWHTKRVATSYTRFQVVVLSAYKQIRAQDIDVLSDIDEDNYDRAFSFLRPVIQGASDMGARLSETELQKSLDFCVKLFDPTTPEQHERVARGGWLKMKTKFGNGNGNGKDERRLDAKALKELMDVTTPVVDPAVLERALRVETYPDLDGKAAPRNDYGNGKGVNHFERSPGIKTRQSGGRTITFRDRSHSESYFITSRDRSTSSSSTDSTISSSSTSSEAEKAIETQLVLHKINARRVVQSEYEINNLESEPLNGLVVRMERGRLGLMQVVVV